MAPTKFGSLLKVLTPILEGGAIGAFSGKGHPGGGFGAAQDFYTARRAYQLQMAQFQRQSALTQSQIDERSRANDIAQERADREDWGQPFQAQDADGNPVFVVRNRRTGETRQVNGFAPPDRSDPANTHMTDQGLVNVGRNGKATRVTLDEGTGVPAGPLQSTGVVQFAGQTSPLYVGRKPGLAKNPITGVVSRTGPMDEIPGSPGGAPLHAPGYDKPQHKNDFEQFYDKYLDDNQLDDTAANQLKARAAYESAGRKPESDGSLTGAAYTKRQGQYIDQLNRGFADSERQRQKDIRALGKDPTLSPDELTSKQQQIEEDNADRKQTLHQRIADSAASQGINIGDVPDYRAQLTGGRQGGGVPNAPPNSARSNGGKVAGAADVAAWAHKKGISINAARSQFKAKGYTIQGSPQ